MSDTLMTIAITTIAALLFTGIGDAIELYRRRSENDNRPGQRLPGSKN